MRQGDIVIIDFPFTDFSEFKERPALVVSNTDVPSPDFIFCEVTSRNRESKLDVTLSSNDLKKGRLPKTSYVRLFRVAVFHKDLVKKVVARVSDKKMKEVYEKIKLLFEKRE